ncbi:unnamed protein product, partial [Oppiella nova]
MGQVPDQYFLPDLQNNSKMFPKDLQYGQMESAFDSFNLTVYNQSYSGLDIHIPEPAVHFMAQIKTSTFIECNYEMAVNFHRQYKKKYTEGPNKDSQVKDALQALNHMARSLGSIPIYISSGTLLGWYRQCGVIPYTSDLDTATWAMYASNEATDRWLNNDVGFRLAYIYGLIENGYQYAFYSRYNLRVDVFYTYRELPNLTYTGHKPSQKLYFRYWYPYFELCSAELVGLKVQVPCTPESVVSAEYGPNFYTPVSDWNYMASAYNTGPHRYWANDEEAKRAYRDGKYGKVIALLVCLTLLFILLAYHMVSYGWESQYRIPGRHQASHGFTNRVSGHETYAAEVVMFDTSDLWFTEHAMDFMQIVDDFKLRVFLIEPIILYLMIDWKHKKLLDVRDLLPDHLMDDIMGSKLYCLSFGVFMNEFGFQHKLHQELTKRSFNISMIDGLDGSQRHFATDVTQMDETVLHLFYTKDDECIQISVFHKRNDFLWVGEIPVHRNESYNFMDIFYGKHESAFDSFGLQSVKVVRNIKLLIPDRVVHFISQYKSSKFIECDYSLAKSMTKIYPKSESMDRKVRESLIALKMFTSKHLTPFFITGGTLLGWYGHCGVIPYTTDVDTGMWSTYASPQLIDTFIRNTNDFK